MENLEESETPILDLKTQRFDASAAENSGDETGLVVNLQQLKLQENLGLSAILEYELREEKGIEQSGSSIGKVVGNEAREVESEARGEKGIESFEESSSGVVENETRDEKGSDRFKDSSSGDVEIETTDEKGSECFEESLSEVIQNEGTYGVEGMIKESGVVKSETRDDKGSLRGEKGCDGITGNVKEGEVLESETREKMGSESNRESSGGVLENEVGEENDGIMKMAKGDEVAESETRDEMGSESNGESPSLDEKGCDGIRGMVEESEATEVKDSKSSSIGESSSLVGENEKGCDVIMGMPKDGEFLENDMTEEKSSNGCKESLGVVVKNEVGEGKCGGAVIGKVKGSEDGSLNEIVENEDNDRDGGYMEKNQHPFPIRPEAGDCSFYMKTGSCKFGLNCRFNHPVKRESQYLRSGGSKFGNSYKYNPTKGNTSADQNPEFNFLGLPIRLGEKECPYYMRTGSCKYGANCRFNHPDPTTVGNSEPLRTGDSGPVILQDALGETMPHMMMIFPPAPALPSQNKDWNSYQVVYPPERSIRPSSASVMKIPMNERNVSSHQQQQLPVEEFPERPGQRECSYYLRNGDCRFKSNCKYHHPKNRTPKSLQCPLSDKGLPLRPGQNVCTYYSHYGICKFGPACRYDHPINLTPNLARENVPTENGHPSIRQLL